AGGGVPRRDVRGLVGPAFRLRLPDRFAEPHACLAGRSGAGAGEPGARDLSRGRQRRLCGLAAEARASPRDYAEGRGWVSGASGVKMARHKETGLQTSGDIDPAIRIQEIKQLLKAPDSEDQRFRNTQLLRKADDWLAMHVRERGNPERLVLLHVKVMRVLRDWGRVIERVRDQKWKNKRVRARALCEAANAYMHLQEFISAERCFGEAVKLDPEVEPRVAKAKARLDDQLRLDLYG